MKILVVDDSSFQRKRIVSALSGQGWTLTEAANGAEALEKVKSESFDLICTDLLMPEMDGLQFMQSLQEISYPGKIVVLTADVQETTREKCLEQGASLVISKPFKKEQLSEQIAKHLGESRCP